MIRQQGMIQATRKMLLCTLPLAVALTGCGKPSDNGGTPVKKPDDKPIGAQGMCTGEFVGSYGDVNTLELLVQRAESEPREILLSRLREMLVACRKFHATYAQVVCKAKNLSSGIEETLKSESLVTKCNAADARLKDVSQPSPSPSPTPSPSPSPSPEENPGDSRVLREVYSHQIFMTVKNTELVEKAMENGELVFVKGKIGTLLDFQGEMLSGATACFFVKRPTDFPGIGEGASLRVLAKAEGVAALGGRQVSMITSGKADLSCVKMTRPSFIVKDLRDSLKEIIEISLNQ